MESTGENEKEWIGIESDRKQRKTRKYKGTQGKVMENK